MSRTGAGPLEPSRWDEISEDEIENGDHVRLVSWAGWMTEGVARWEADAAGDRGILWLDEASGASVDGTATDNAGGQALASRLVRELYIKRYGRRR